LECGNFFKLKKIKKIRKIIKNFKKMIKSGIDMLHVLLKNVNYLNTINKNDRINQNLTKMKI